MRARVLVVVVVVGVAGSSCSLEQGLERPANQLTLRSPVAGGSPTLELGEDCSRYGRAACLSNECLHAGFETTTRYVCSKRCAVDDDCPLNWFCNDILPGGQHRYCIPRVDEGGRPAQPRPSAVPQPPQPPGP